MRTSLETLHADRSEPTRPSALDGRAVDPREPVTSSASAAASAVFAADALEREQQLAVMVPASVKAAVRRRAHAEGITVRALLLRLIREAGIASVMDADLTDRRIAAAALKSRLYREAIGRD